MKNKYKLITIIAAIVICFMVIYLHLLSHMKTQDIYLKQTKRNIMNLRKDFLKDTVNNISIEIDRVRETKYNNYKKNTKSRLKRFEDELDLSEGKFAECYIRKFNEDTNPKMWKALLWRKSTGEILYNSSTLDMEDIDSLIDNLKSIISYTAIIDKDDIQGIFGVSKSYIDELVKEEVGDLIRTRKFSNNSHILVKEIVNYKGGKDYAIRKIHPILSSTEGVYLSTDMKDVKGNQPYLEELEGVKRYGELFLTYFIPKPNDFKISERITFSKLYKEYDWIITMGIYLDDIDTHIKKTSDEMNSLSKQYIMELLRYIFIVLAVGFTIIYLIDKKNLSLSTMYLQREINLDSLTKAFSRRYGERSLNNLFRKYKLTGENPAIMIFDIDNFKHINDTYGHSVGDIVLVEVVETINNIIRSSDEIIRWGGDEFVGVFQGLKEKSIIEFGEKILTAVTLIQIPLEDQTIEVSISLGFSYFKNTDIDYDDVIKRADTALYKSKDQGKNTVNLVL